jgi:glycosyltransferase involved in cell wall biosynthesis
MPELNPPDLVQPPAADSPFCPSWSGRDGYLNDEHRGIHGATRELPGWQDPADSEKLYEMAYHAGSVILEVGVFGGRSAVVELRGALAAARDRGLPNPQYYGVDIDPGFFDRSIRTVEDAGLSERCLFYHGNLGRFLRDIPVTPTMVFLDGDHRYPGVWSDLNLLRRALAPGTPMLCHDYGGIPDVARAVDEWVAEGSFTAMGRFAGSVLLRCTGKWSVPRRARGLSEDVFGLTRSALAGLYSSREPSGIRRGRHRTPVRTLTREARLELRGPNEARVTSGRAAWPYAPDPASLPVPSTMPGGKPWPRITVVTPSYNQGKYIEETILSVLHQGYPNLEYIVMDGGSGDETLAVAAHYRDRIDYFESQRDKGQADAINKGFARATGTILTWLNSDDMLAPGALAAAALAFDRSGADMVAGEVHIYRDGRPAQKHLTSCGDGPLPLDELLDIDHCWMTGQFFYQPEVMFTREIWDKAGGHLDEGLYHSLDYELWVRLAEAGARLHVIGRPLALFRAHPEQKTAGMVVGGFRAELPRVRDAILERTGRVPVSHAVENPRRRLRVALFNDLGYSYGAGIAHRRMTEAFACAGHEVRAFSALSAEPRREVASVSEADVLDRLREFRPDLVVIGNLHGAGLEPSLVGRIAGEFESVFVLHDQWLLTGRCAYPGSCRTYLEGCGPACACAPGHPDLHRDLVASAWERKRRMLASSPRLTLWANSRWALKHADEALDHPAQAALLGSRPATSWIRFGLELDVFRPRDKVACRDALGLPLDRFIVMSSASSLADPRKGLSHLATAMEMLDLADALVVCPGWFRPGESAPIRDMRMMGYMREQRELAALYSAADLFVGPSLEEAFGQVFIEAAACGTPSVGYPVGGVPEAIADGVSGRLADRVNPESLADAIDELYRDPGLRRDMGAWGRLWVEAEFSMSASYHRLHRAMWETGMAERLRLSRKIDLALSPDDPPAPILVPTTEPGWRAVEGFDPWEGPYKDRGVPRGRWARGPLASLEVDSPSAGRGRLVIAYCGFEEGQRVRLMSDGQAVAEADAPPTRRGGPRVLSFPVPLEAGPNRFDLAFWKWKSGPRPIAVLVTSITLVPPAAAVELKPALLQGRPVPPEPSAESTGAVR